MILQSTQLRLSYFSIFENSVIELSSTSVKKDRLLIGSFLLPFFLSFLNILAALSTAF